MSQYLVITFRRQIPAGYPAVELPVLLGQPGGQPGDVLLDLGDAVRPVAVKPLK
jgi:hypothetical protein